MHPTLFTIGPVHIHSYGTLLMLGWAAGVFVSWREARRRGLPPELALDLGIWALVAGVVSARLLYVAMNWADFAPRPLEVLYVWREGGLSFHGGLLGGVLAGTVFAKRRAISFWTLADMLAPGVALAYGIARFGCFLNGCCYGVPTELPWGVRFPLWPDSQITTDPSHPTQLYAAFGSFAIFGVLMLVRGRLAGCGRLFLLYLMLYAPMRAAIEVLRKGVTARVLFDGVTEAQLASAAIFLAALVAFLVRGRGRRLSGEPGSPRRP